MRQALAACVIILLWLESSSPGSGLAVIMLSAWLLGIFVQSPYAGLAIGLIFLMPAFMLGADWRAKAILEEEQKRLNERKQKWRIF